MTTLAHHAALNRALAEVEARLHAVDPPAPERHGDDADQRTARQAHEDLIVERARLVERRRRILAALVKIERGEYGLCESCADPIPKKRLTAVPWTPRCLGCQARDELRAARLPTPERPPAPHDEEPA